MVMRSEMSMVALAALLIAGCESSKSVDFSPFQGIYQIDSHTLNSSACDVEGTPVAGSQPLLVLFPYFVVSLGSFATANPCADATACRDRAANPAATAIVVADIAAQFAPLFFQVTADGLTGSVIETCCTGASGQTNCGEAGGEEDKLVKDGSTIRIEIREWDWTGTVAQAGMCQATKAARALAGTCSNLRVVNATFQEAL